MKIEHTITSFFDQLVLMNIPSKEFLNKYKDFAKSFEDGNLLMEIVEKLKEENLVLEKLATKSYAHENGFTKLVLWENVNSKFKLRLHYWEGENKYNSNIHNHRFNFASYILKGKIKNVNWMIKENGGVFNYYHYLPRLEKGVYQMCKIGNENLHISEETFFEEGDAYYVDKKTLHTSENCSEHLITLFLEYRDTLEKYAKVYTNNYVEKADFIITSPSYSTQDYLDCLNKISIILKNVG